MITFITKVIVFSLSIVIVLIFPLYVLVLGKEFTSIESVVKAQLSNPKTIFSFAYNDESFVLYKEKLTEVYNPEVVALGTSRVMQFRKEFFIPGVTFINAGGAGKTLADQLHYIEQLNASTSVIILGVEQDAFYVPQIREQVTSKTPFDYTRLVTTNARRIYLDYLNQKYSFTELLNADETKIGLSAIIHGDGFRADGSYHYEQARNNKDRLSYVSLKVADQINHLSPDAVTDQEQKLLSDNLLLLEQILSVAKSKNIAVVGFMPPYPEPLYKALLLNEGKDAHKLTMLPKEVALVFKRQGAVFLDLSTIETFKGEGSEFVDAIHGTDRMYAKIILYISRYSPELKQYVNIDFLRSSIVNSQNDFLNF